MEVAIGNAVGTQSSLHIELDEQPDGHVTGRFIYNTDLFDPSTAHSNGRPLEPTAGGHRDRSTATDLGASPPHRG